MEVCWDNKKPSGDMLPGQVNINSLPNIPIYYIQILTLYLLWINIGSKFNDNNVLKYLKKEGKVMKDDNCDPLSLDKSLKAKLIVDMVTRIAVHYGLWFTEARHQM